MSFDIDDPRLTAYALGELDEKERGRIEAALAQDPAARAEVEALRALAGSLETELAAEDAPVLTDTQRETVRAGTASRRRRLWIPVAAACVLLGFVTWMFGLTETRVEVREKTPAEVATELAESSRAVSWEGESSAPRDVTRAREERSTFGSIEARHSGPGGTSVAGGGGGHSEAGVDVDPTDGRVWELELGREESEIGVPPPPDSQPAPGPTSVVAAGTTGSALKPRVVTANPTDGTPSYGDRPVTGGIMERPGAGSGGGASVSARRDGSARTPHGETYHLPPIKGFALARREHTSTFSVDVDTASYSNIRRILNSGRLPAWNAVRIEEMVNYFTYGYAAPEGGADLPFAVHTQVAECPWNPDHRLARIALQGRRVAKDKRPLSNLVFLVDVSGSMDSEDKLPLLKSGLEMLTEQLGAGDRVAIVTYSGTAGVALEPTSGTNKDAILSGIRALKAGGSTNGASGIQVAYDVASKGFLEKGVNRVILCTDGDFNVGVSSDHELVKLIEKKAKTGVHLSVLGFGTGNYKDAKMEALSNRGDGNYAYVDSLDEAKRVLVEEMSGTLVTIAKDVKVQIFFNPAKVSGYRLLGYENRRLAARDFNDDAKDAGEIGAGHAVTALYEIVPAGRSLPGSVDPNPYVQPKPTKPEVEAKGDGLFTLRLRWKRPGAGTSRLLEREVRDELQKIGQADKDFQWAASVAAFGMLLRNSPYKASANYGLVLEMAKAAKGEDPDGRRAEFIGLVQKASGVSPR